MFKYYDKVLLHLLQLSKDNKISAAQMRVAVEAAVSMVCAKHGPRLMQGLEACIRHTSTLAIDSY